MKITIEKLRAALRLWEEEHRAGRTRSHAESLAIPIDQVAHESATHLWKLLSELPRSE